MSHELLNLTSDTQEFDKEKVLQEARAQEKECQRKRTELVDALDECNRAIQELHAIGIHTGNRLALNIESLIPTNDFSCLRTYATQIARLNEALAFLKTPDAATAMQGIVSLKENPHLLTLKKREKLEKRREEVQTRQVKKAKLISEQTTDEEDQVDLLLENEGYQSLEKQAAHIQRELKELDALRPIPSGTLQQLSADLQRCTDLLQKELSAIEKKQIDAEVTTAPFLREAKKRTAHETRQSSALPARQSRTRTMIAAALAAMTTGAGYLALDTLTKDRLSQRKNVVKDAKDEQKQQNELFLETPHITIDVEGTIRDQAIHGIASDQIVSPEIIQNAENLYRNGLDMLKNERLLKELHRLGIRRIHIRDMRELAAKLLSVQKEINNGPHIIYILSEFAKKKSITVELEPNAIGFAPLTPKVQLPEQPAKMQISFSEVSDAKYGKKAGEWHQAGGMIWYSLSEYITITHPNTDPPTMRRFTEQCDQFLAHLQKQGISLRRIQRKHSIAPGFRSLETLTEDLDRAWKSGFFESEKTRKIPSGELGPK